MGPSQISFTLSLKFINDKMGGAMPAPHREALRDENVHKVLRTVPGQAEAHQRVPHPFPHSRLERWSPEVSQLEPMRWLKN